MKTNPYVLYGQAFTGCFAAMRHFAIENHDDLAWHVRRSKLGLSFVPRHKVNAHPQGEQRRKRYFAKVLKENGFTR